MLANRPFLSSLGWSRPEDAYYCFTSGSRNVGKSAATPQTTLWCNFHTDLYRETETLVLAFPPRNPYTVLPTQHFIYLFILPFQADLCVPRLNEGDQVVQINGRDISDHTHDQVVMFIKATCESHSGELILLVRPNGESLLCVSRSRPIVNAKLI